MKTNISLTNLKAFTLIELLIVITIIGILATGAVSIYTSQIQKARDTTRMNDVKALQSAVEQYYQDESFYATASGFLDNIGIYMSIIPKDGKHGDNCNNGGTTGSGAICALAYRVNDDANGIEYGAYELSTGFENGGNVKSKANDDADNGNDDLRLEEGNLRATINTTVDTAITLNKGACTTTGTSPADEKDLIVINGTGACD